MVIIDVTWSSVDTQVTHLRLYRTLTGGSAYYYDQELPIQSVANTDYAQFGWNTTDGNGSGYVYLSGTGVSVEGITFSYPV